ncbi:MAG: prolipoprotein diacylglyceryl transferase [Ruminococcus sp.]|jgi:phosphatidylglycerol:prolipoprotein diacylglycerol transferase|nr:prolipoprotein diacylglyceryl transferase [Ruminococcus sp.]
MLPPIQIFDRIITGYGIAVAVGLIVCLFYIMRQSKRIYGTDGDILLITAIAGGAAVFFSHLLFGIISLLTYGGFPTITSFDGFLRFLNDFFGGSVFFGGLIGGAVAVFITLKIMKFPWYPAVDLITTVVPLFHFFGRVGCFLGGCCYGIPSRFGFTFSHSIVESANGVNRFPVQLLEASFNLLLFFALYRLFRGEKLCGRLFFLYLACYSPARFLLEFLRGDSYRGLFALGDTGVMLSTSQIISVFTLAVGIIGLIVTKNTVIKNQRNRN